MGKVIITGGAGFIGSHVARKCLAAGYEVVVLDDLSSGKRENLPDDVLLHQVDVVDSREVQKIFELLKPKHVIHLAAQISVSRSVREPAFDAKTNILGLLNVAQSAARCGVSSFIFGSSGGVLYGNVEEPADECHEIRPVSPYGIAKLTGERYLQFFATHYGLSCTAMRYANVYGPRQDPYGEAGVVAIFFERLLRGQPCVINGDGKYIRDYVYVEDVAEANLLALQDYQCGFRAYNVGTGIPTDVCELEKKVRRNLLTIREHADVSNLPEPEYGLPRPGDLRSSLLDARAIGEDLGWTPRFTLDEGLGRTALWFAKKDW